MSLCEKNKSYEKEIRGHLGIQDYARILNLTYSKDTGQFTVQLQSDTKHEHKSVTLPEEVAKEVSNFVLSKCYPYFEARQAEMYYNKQFSEGYSALVEQVDEAFELESVEIAEAFELKTDEISAKYGFMIQQMQKETESLEEYKEMQSAVKAKTNEMRDALDKVAKDQEAALSAKKEEIEDRIIGKAKRYLEDKVKEIKGSYGI